jgi:hypothetical protein
MSNPTTAPKPYRTHQRPFSRSERRRALRARNREAFAKLLKGLHASSDRLADLELAERERTPYTREELVSAFESTLRRY